MVQPQLVGNQEKYFNFELVFFDQSFQALISAFYMDVGLNFVLYLLGVESEAQRTQGLLELRETWIDTENDRSSRVPS